jgi:hypothetical protein
MIKEMKKMKNLKALIKSLENTAKTKWAIKEDMADMYQEDAADTAAVLTHILGGKFDRAENKLSDMDSLPRDNAIMAVATDKGADWVADNLGWNVRDDYQVDFPILNLK